MKTFNDFLLSETVKDDINAAAHITSANLDDSVKKRLNAMLEPDYDRLRRYPPVLKIKTNDKEHPVTGKFFINNPERDFEGEGHFVCLMDGRIGRTDGPAYYRDAPDVASREDYLLDDYKIFSFEAREGFRTKEYSIAFTFGLLWLIQQVNDKNSDAIQLFKTLFTERKEAIIKELMENICTYCKDLSKNFKLSKIVAIKMLSRNDLHPAEEDGLSRTLTPELEYDILSKDPSLATKISALDPKLLDNIKSIDKKYNLDLAEEIEARIS